MNRIAQEINIAVKGLKSSKQSPKRKVAQTTGDRWKLTKRPV
jgi:hypothetical protein